MSDITDPGDIDHEALLDLVHGLDAVVWRYDVASDRFTFVSDYAETLLGHPISAWSDFESWTMLIHPDDRTRAAEFCRTETTRGNDHTFEYRSVRPDGTEVWLRDVVRVTRDDAGGVAQLYGVLLDITDSRRAREDLLSLATEQEAQSSIAMAVAEDRPADEVFAVIAQAAAHALGTELAAVVEFTGEEIALRGLWGVTEHSVGDTLSTQVVGALQDVRRTGRAQRLTGSELEADDDVGSAVRRERITSAVLVPVTVAGRTWGCLAVGARVGELPRDTEPRMERLARTAATGVSHADARARLVQHATTDALTGLANHRAFQERLRTEVARAHRYQRPLSVVLIDLDGFKLVNDTHGHAAGDRALAEVAMRLRALARPGDVLARVGGDEFAWILPETDSMGGYSAAERARAAIAGRELLPEITADSSAGVCGLEEAEGPDELMRLADGALYWAKAHGRGVTYRYSPSVVRELSAAERAERLARQRTLAGLSALARAVDAKDHSTHEHSERVADLAEMLAVEIGFDVDGVMALREAALLHDVGKIGVPDAILSKSGKLTDDEFEAIKAHAALGATIASEVLDTRQVAWIRSHHERWDGRGYPDGLAGEAIPAGARILCLADSWDVMTHVRSYKAALEPSLAIEECLRCAGTQFGEDMVDALLRLWRRGSLDPATGDLMAHLRS